MSHPTGTREQPGSAVRSRSDHPPRAVGRTLMSAERDLGIVEELVEVGDHGFYLVDTRHWTYGSKRLVPCDSVHESARAATVVSDVDDATIRSAPDFDPFQLGQQRYHDELVRHYRLEPAT